MADNYTVVDEIVDDDVGLVARVTGRTNANGMRHYSFCFIRGYDKNGGQHETSWMDRRHIAACMRLLIKVDERIQIENDRAARLKR